MIELELEGVALDCAVAKAKGEAPGAAYSSDWSHGGPVIQRARIELGFMGDGHGWQAAVNPMGSADWTLKWVDGPTPLIAAMRAYVASREPT